MGRRKTPRPALCARQIARMALGRKTHTQRIHTLTDTCATKRGTSFAQPNLLLMTTLPGRYKLYPTHQLKTWLRRPAGWTLATKTSTATSMLFLVAIMAVGMASMQSFRGQLMSVMIEEQDTLVERIADNLDQKLLALQRVLLLSAIEITEADIASSDAAQRYLDSNTGLFAAVDRSTFLFSADGSELLAERPFRPNRRGDQRRSPVVYQGHDSHAAIGHLRAVPHQRRRRRTW